MGDKLEMVFKECETCAAKTGAPLLCAGCLHNRTVIGRLTETRPDIRQGIPAEDGDGIYENPSQESEWRDLFAAFALMGLVASGRYNKADEASEKVAIDSYWYADAMLAERDKHA